MEILGMSLSKLWEESVSMLRSPKTYFSAMPKEGGIVEPVKKAIIYGSLSGLIFFVGRIFSTPFFSNLAGLVLSPVYAVIGLLIGAFVIQIISAIAGGDTNFGPSARAAAALMVILPLNTISLIIGFIIHFLGAAVILLIDVYGIVLLYHALVSALGAKEKTVKIMLGIVAVILLVFMAAGLFFFFWNTHFASMLNTKAKQAVVNNLPTPAENVSNSQAEKDLRDVEKMTKDMENSKEYKQAMALQNDPEYVKIVKESTEAAEKGDMKKLGEISGKLQEIYKKYGINK